jgi:hypothetical protein
MERSRELGGGAIRLSDTGRDFLHFDAVVGLFTGPFGI